MKFTTISKIPNISQMLIIPFLSMHYTYSGCIISNAVEVICLSVMDYHTGWTASLLCECATHAAEQDSPAIRFRWCAAESTAGRAPQWPSYLDHFRSLARPFACAFSSPTLWTECSTLLTEMSIKVACFQQMMARLPKSSVLAMPCIHKGHVRPVQMSALLKLGVCHPQLQ